jgi:hypothetical protein
MTTAVQRCIAVAAIALDFGVLPSIPGAAREPVAVTPFKVHVEDSVLTDLRERLAKTRWPDQAHVGDMRIFFSRVRRQENRP